VEVLPPDGTDRTGRVLVLEDDAGISELWTIVLEGEGYQVVCRESALGLTTLLQRWCPDVILLDLGLPYRSGGSMLGELKEDPKTAAIPVVVISGAPESLTRERAAQAAAVLTKPVPMQTLLATIRAVRRAGG
jgi:DNA-binding response OmpR family regulator